jgi:hypothetical protein
MRQQMAVVVHREKEHYILLSVSQEGVPAEAN